MMIVSHQTLGCKGDEVLKHEDKNNTLLATGHKNSSTSTRETNSLHSKVSIRLASDVDEDVDDEEDDGAADGHHTGATHNSAGYELAPDCSDEDDTGLEGENGVSSVYMERVMVGAQWQVHVQQSNSSRDGLTIGTCTAVSIEEAPDSSDEDDSVYMERVMVDDQWQVHVQSDSTRDGLTKGTCSAVSIEEDTEEKTKLTDEWAYESRPSVF